MFGFHFLKVSRLGVANQESCTVPSIRFHEVDFLKIMKFSKILTLVRVQASKVTKSARWHDFNALRRAHVSFQVIRGVVAPKGNIVYKGNCSTKGGRTIHTLSNFDLHFRDHKCCVLKTFGIVVSAGV